MPVSAQCYSELTQVLKKLKRQESDVKFQKIFFNKLVNSETLWGALVTAYPKHFTPFKAAGLHDIFMRVTNMCYELSIDDDRKKLFGALRLNGADEAQLDRFGLYYRENMDRVKNVV